MRNLVPRALFHLREITRHPLENNEARGIRDGVHAVPVGVTWAALDFHLTHSPLAWHTREAEGSDIRTVLTSSRKTGDLVDVTGIPGLPIVLQLHNNRLRSSMFRPPSERIVVEQLRGRDAVKVPTDLVVDTMHGVVPVVSVAHRAEQHLDFLEPATHHQLGGKSQYGVVLVQGSVVRHQVQLGRSLLGQVMGSGIPGWLVLDPAQDGVQDGAHPVRSMTPFVGKVIEVHVAIAMVAQAERRHKHPVSGVVLDIFVRSPGESHGGRVIVRTIPISGLEIACPCSLLSSLRQKEHSC